MKRKKVKIQISQLNWSPREESSLFVSTWTKTVSWNKHLEEHFLGQSSAKEHCFLKKGNKVNFGLLSFSNNYKVIWKENTDRQTSKSKNMGRWENCSWKTLKSTQCLAKFLCHYSLNIKIRLEFIFKLQKAFFIPLCLCCKTFFFALETCRTEV